MVTAPAANGNTGLRPRRVHVLHLARTVSPAGRGGADRSAAPTEAWLQSVALTRHRSARWKLVDTAARMEEAGVERIVHFMHKCSMDLQHSKRPALCILSLPWPPHGRPDRGTEVVAPQCARPLGVASDPRPMSEANHNHRRDPDGYERALRDCRHPRCRCCVVSVTSYPKKMRAPW